MVKLIIEHLPTWSPAFAVFQLLLATNKIYIVCFLAKVFFLWFAQSLSVWLHAEISSVTRRSRRSCEDGTKVRDEPTLRSGETSMEVFSGARWAWWALASDMRTLIWVIFASWLNIASGFFFRNVFPKAKPSYNPSYGPGTSIFRYIINCFAWSNLIFQAFTTNRRLETSVCRV